MLGTSNYKNQVCLPEKLMSEEMEVVLKSSLWMPAHTRKFHPLQMLYYINENILFICKFNAEKYHPEIGQQESQVRIPLLAEFGETSVDKIRIVTMNPYDLVIIGFSRVFCLYRLSTGEALQEFGIPNSNQTILYISDPVRCNNSTNCLIVSTLEGSLHLVYIEHIGGLNIRVVPLVQPSIMTSLTSFFKKSQPSWKQCRTYGFLHPGSQEVIVLAASNQSWQMFRIDTGQFRTTKLWETRDFLDKQGETIRDMSLVSTSVSQTSLVSVYCIVQVNSISKLLKFSLDITSGRKLQRQSNVLCSRQPQTLEMLCTTNKLFVVIKESHNTPTSIDIFDIRSGQLRRQRQIRIEGLVVLGYDIVVTEALIYKINIQFMLELSFSNNSADSRSVFGGKNTSFNATVEYFEQQTRKLMETSERFQNLVAYAEVQPALLRQQLVSSISIMQRWTQQLLRCGYQELYALCFVEILMKKIQLNMLDNVANPQLRQPIELVTAPESYVTFFGNSGLVPLVLAKIAQGKSWQYLIDLARIIQNKLQSSQTGTNTTLIRNQISKRTMGAICLCLNREDLVQPKQSELRQRLDELATLAALIDPQYPELHDYLIGSGNQNLFWELCMEHKLSSGVARLYTQTNSVDRDHLLSFMQTVPRAEFVAELARHYFQYNNGRKIASLKLAIDLYDYTEQLYEIAKGECPQLAWVIGISSGIDLSELNSLLQHTSVNDSENFRMILNLQKICQQQNPAIDTKIKILDVCEQLGWGPMSPEEFVNVIAQKSTSEIQLCNRKVGPLDIGQFARQIRQSFDIKS